MSNLERLLLDRFYTFLFQEVLYHIQEAFALWDIKPYDPYTTGETG